MKIVISAAAVFNALGTVLALTPVSGADAAYSYDFHYDAYGSYAAADIVYSANSLNPSSLQYVSGSVNGFSPAKIYYQTGLGFDGYGFQFSGPVGSVDGFQFGTSAKLTSPGSFATTQAGRSFYNGNGSSNVRYTTGLLTISQVFYFDFHFDAYGSYAAADVVYSANSLNPSSLQYVSGSVNGFSPAKIYYQTGLGFDGYSSQSSRSVGSVDEFQFGTSAKLTSPGSFATTQAGRYIYNGNGSSITRYTTGLLTISSTPPAAVPEFATWAMMVVGMGAIGGALRRRKFAGRVSYAG